MYCLVMHIMLPSMIRNIFRRPRNVEVYRSSSLGSSQREAYYRYIYFVGSSTALQQTHCLLNHFAIKGLGSRFSTHEVEQKSTRPWILCQEVELHCIEGVYSPFRTLVFKP